MNNYEEIIEKDKEQKIFDKNEWKLKKQKERQEIFELLDKTLDGIQNNVQQFQTYLDVQSHFDKYTVSNAILIMAQKPNAIKIKDYEAWKKEGAYLLKNEKSFVILEPSDTYKKNDGRQTTYFNPKRVFDISQTNLSINNKKNSYDNKIMLNALLHNCSVDVKALDNLPNGMNAEWNKDDNVLYIKKGLDGPILFQSLTKEMARADFVKSDNELNNFKSYCISYMICKKYNIDVTNYKIDKMPETLQNMDLKEFKNELSDIRNGMQDINARIGLFFENLSKNKQKNYEQER